MGLSYISSIICDNIYTFFTASLEYLRRWHTFCGSTEIIVDPYPLNIDVMFRKGSLRRESSLRCRYQRRHALHENFMTTSALSRRAVGIYGNCLIRPETSINGWLLAGWYMYEGIYSVLYITEELQVWSGSHRPRRGAMVPEFMYKVGKPGMAPLQ